MICLIFSLPQNYLDFLGGREGRCLPYIISHLEPLSRLAVEDLLGDQISREPLMAPRVWVSEEKTQL